MHGLIWLCLFYMTDLVGRNIEMNVYLYKWEKNYWKKNFKLGV